MHLQVRLDTHLQTKIKKQVPFWDFQAKIWHLSPLPPLHSSKVTTSSPSQSPTTPPNNLSTLSAQFGCIKDPFTQNQDYCSKWFSLNVKNNHFAVWQWVSSSIAARLVFIYKYSNFVIFRGGSLSKSGSVTQSVSQSVSQLGSQVLVKLEETSWAALVSNSLFGWSLQRLHQILSLKKIWNFSFKLEKERMSQFLA